ncbi:MAG: endopeptidase La, partial [Oligoflexales bacterium]|nr:endopeptidase La [Oligoflexales bacterium]
IVNKALESTLDAPFDVYNIGTVCSIMRTRKLPDGRMKVLVQGLYKGRINRLERANPHPVVSVDKISDPAFETKSADIEAMIRAVREHLEKVVSLGKVLSPDILMILEDVKEPGRLADLVAANLGLKVNEAQSILAIYHPVERLTRVHHFLSREIEVYQMQVRIQSQAKEEIGRMQREHYLREQIRALRSELGDGDQKDDIDEFWKKIESIKLSDSAKEEISKQIKRLERMHQESSEATITRTYIETVFSMPWGTVTSDNIDLKNVAKVLEEDHHGLGQVKDRIIEYMAVKKLNSKAKSPIICFVGPPGVGKTSLGKSIARSMGRNFARIALGGVSDEADIRGHRKTYIGAYPGRVIQAIKQAGSTNPIIMLDEIDKLGSSHRGDPSSALLEILDPAQNHSFVDHYLGIEFDLSNIMFIANANTLETIPAPLRDRLEIIEVSGYSEEEKLVIANRFLIPRQITDAGLNEDEVLFSKSAISTLINHYTRESGLRGLNKKIASICRKIARHAAEYRDEQIEKNKTEKPMPVIRVTPAAVKRYLGANIFSGEFYYKETIVGVSFGLAYTQYGGEVLAIETSLLPANNAKLVLTGQLGDVMKESAQTAYSFVRANAKILGIAKETIDSHELHLHIPAGAIPKDGPSAGIAIASSMISALLARAPKARIAMTGEITLNGLVLPIGGLKEKVLAAQREGIEMILVPDGNKEQLLELPINVRKKSTFVLVKTYSSVFTALFGDNVVEISVRTPGTNSEKIAS